VNGVNVIFARIANSIIRLTLVTAVALLGAVAGFRCTVVVVGWADSCPKGQVCDFVVLGAIVMGLLAAPFRALRAPTALTNFCGGTREFPQSTKGLIANQLPILHEVLQE
jgi:hypothetical protein